MSSITITRLRKIIAEELSLLKEGEMEDQAASMSSDSAKLLKAIESFNSSVSAKAKAMAGTDNVALEKHLKEVEKMLKRIIESPTKYVDGPKPQTELKPGSTTPTMSPTASVPAKKVSITPKVQA